MARYWWAVLEYSCRKGHWNSLNKFYRGPTIEGIRTRLPATLPCTECPAGTVIDFSPLDRLSQVSFRILEVGESDWKASGLPLETDIQ
jgi:hypothetical protein